MPPSERLQPELERPTRRSTSTRNGVGPSTWYAALALLGLLHCSGAGPIAPAPHRDPPALSALSASSASPALSAAMPTLAGRPSAVGERDEDGIAAAADVRSFPSGTNHAQNWHHTLLWQAGVGLASPPVLGPTGAIYVASRQGTLDVLEPAGQHRFTITLGGTPAGAFHVDERGTAYFALATGSIVSVTATGQRTVLYRWPRGIVGDLAFAEGQGLLFRGVDGVTLGLNRGGYPILRVVPRSAATAGPLGIFGWCVVGTASGEIIWANRWGKTARVAVAGAVRELQSAPHGGVWAQLDVGMSAFSAARIVEFHRSDAVLMAARDDGQPQPQAETPAWSGRAAPAEAVRAVESRMQGAILTTRGEVEWLEGSGGALLRVPPAVDETPTFVLMRLDQDARVWLATADGRLYVTHSTGSTELAFDAGGERLFAPIFDDARARVVLATAGGAVMRLERRPSAR